MLLLLVCQDEIGLLLKVFVSMVDQVCWYIVELEDKVQECIQVLEEVNCEMVVVQKKIGDSFDYVSLIQCVIFFDCQFSVIFGEYYFILWKLCDVVGGDFYVYCEQVDGYLIGVVDCVGYGVFGVLMIMFVCVVIDYVIEVVGSCDLVVIFGEIDQVMCSMFSQEQIFQVLVINMDVGLVWVDCWCCQLVFVGVKILLYVSDGEEVQEFKGVCWVIGDKCCGDYCNIEVLLVLGWIFYLSIDGFFDQVGGEYGFGFGSWCFVDMFCDYVWQLFFEQVEVFVVMFVEYQGEYL